MNCDRFVFLIAVSVSSNLVTNSLTVEAKASRVNLVVEQITTPINSNENIDRWQYLSLNSLRKPRAYDSSAFRGGVQFISETSRLSRCCLTVRPSELPKTQLQFDITPERVAENSTSIAQLDPSSNSDRTNEQDNNSKNFTAEPPLMMSKRLGLIGIAISSLISLILLKLLFIPPAKKVSPTPISSAVKSSSKAAESDRALKDTSQSSVDLEARQKPISISLPQVRSDDLERYVAREQSVIENFNTTSQLTVLHSNTIKIDIVLELIKYLQQPDEDLRREAIWELAQTGDSRGIEPLIEILSQVNSTDRSLVLEAITQITRRSFQPIEKLLFLAFEDPSPEIKQNAIRDLAVVYSFVAPIAKQLARMQVDRDLQVRQSAKLAIEQLNLCYFPCLSDDCPGSAKYHSNS